MEKKYSLGVCQLRKSIDFTVKVLEIIFFEPESKI